MFLSFLGAVIISIGILGIVFSLIEIEEGYAKVNGLIISATIILGGILLINYDINRPETIEDLILSNQAEIIMLEKKIERLQRKLERSRECQN